MSTKIWTRLLISAAFAIGLTVLGLGTASHVGAGSNAGTGSVAITNSNAVAQQVLTGVWTASLDKDSSRINLNLERRAEKRGKHQMGHSFDFSDLQGLTREQVLKGGSVRFSIVREAGTIDCEGSFQNGKGSGTFRFAGSQAFVSAMKSRGFDFEKDSDSNDERQDRLFTAAVLNVTTALADDLSSAGFGKLESTIFSRRRYSRSIPPSCVR